MVHHEICFFVQSAAIVTEAQEVEVVGLPPPRDQSQI